MKSSYSKTGNREGKPAYRTPSAFLKRFFSKIRNKKIFSVKRKFNHLIKK